MLVATALSFAVGELYDAVVTIAIVIAVAVLGFKLRRFHISPRSGSLSFHENFWNHEESP